MSYTDDPKFTSLVELTQHRDLRTLRTGLVATIISEIGTAKPTRLYERSNKASPWSVVEFYDIAAQEKIIPLRKHKDIDDLFADSQRKTDLFTLDLIKNNEILTISNTFDDRPRVVFPIYSGKQLISSLIIEGHLSQEEKIYIDTILQVYNNLFLLLKNSLQDCLTGLYNRQAFDKSMRRIDTAGSRKRRGKEKHEEHCCFAFFDIDHFKRVNDDFGHLYGDEILVLFSNLMKEFFRESDDKFRYGGEEFVVMLKDVNLNIAISILNKFRDKVSKFIFPQIGKITVSIGVAFVDKRVPMITVIERADKSVYYSKTHGRNKVSAWENLVANDLLDYSQSTEVDVSLS